MNYSFDSPIFEELLRLNPWARRLWAERTDLIRSRHWNVNGVNQAGNIETQNWLTEFFRASSQATLALLLDRTSVYDDWERQIAAIANRTIFDKPVWNTPPGTPAVWIGEAAYVNKHQEINGYSVGQFRADVILLTTSILRDIEICEGIDIHGKTFPVGLDLVNTKFSAPLDSRCARFGWYSEFNTCNFVDADFAEASFVGIASFTISEFEGSADFTRASFWEEAAFNGASFRGPVAFAETQFRNGAQFNGTMFGTRPDFTRAVFEGSSSFADATFKDSITLQDASFPGRVYVGHIPEEVRKAIESANHP